MKNDFIFKVLIPESDEEIVKVVRQTKNQLTKDLILPATIITVAFFLFFTLFHFGNWGILIFSALLLTGLFLLIKKIYLWQHQALVITTKRVVDIDQQKLFQRVVSDVALEKIEDVFYRVRGVMQTITKVGDIQITVSQSKTKIEIKNINNPQRVQQLIIQLKNDLHKTESELSAAELVNLVKKIKTGLGEEKFNELVGEDKDKIA